VENPRLPHENQDKKLNAVVLSTSDRRISTNLSSCPVNRPLPVSFLTEKPWRSPSLSLSSYKNELLQASSSFFLSTISLSPTRVFSFSFSLHRPFAGEIAVAGEIFHQSFSHCEGFSLLRVIPSFFVCLFFCVDIKEKHFFEGL